jgi:serine/threonine protein kinase
MAPEVLTGKNTSADPAIDIFSMGVILFALITGRLPFDGDD